MHLLYPDYRENNILDSLGIAILIYYTLWFSPTLCGQVELNLLYSSLNPSDGRRGYGRYGTVCVGVGSYSPVAGQRHHPRCRSASLDQISIPRRIRYVHLQTHELGKLTQKPAWRHLDFFQHQACINARVPHTNCPACGVKLVDVPWAQAGRSDLPPLVPPVSAMSYCA